MDRGFLAHLYWLRSTRVKESGSALLDIPILIGAEVTLSAYVDFQYLKDGSEVKYFRRTKILVCTSFGLHWTGCIMYRYIEL
jgi:hypothetical protein